MPCAFYRHFEQRRLGNDEELTERLKRHDFKETKAIVANKLALRDYFLGQDRR